MAYKNSLGKVLSAIDNKNYDYHNKLDSDSAKEITPLVLMRYISDVTGDSDTYQWFIERTNQSVNKHHWHLAKNHKDLLWRLCAVVGAGFVAEHKYIKTEKQKISKFEKLLIELYPTYKLEDIKLLASLMTDEEKTQLFDNLGFDKKQRKEFV
jgi:hypothetical protein